MLPLPPLVPAGQLQVSSPASSGLAAATSPFRRAMSTGDLLIRDKDRDDREEEQRRIDKYRSKRNQRNFQKKITYACRKTLADSRPRVKGRFARNAGDGTEADLQPAAAAAAPPQSESESEWWPAAQHEAGMDLDEDMLAAYLGVSSISLYSPSASTTLPHHHYSYQP
ncbi:two-component response regulator-like APRR3 [Setaria italica]|nr:two-component response regulator-like APRR3 [Setaria italica]